MVLHLLKIAVGIESIAHLREVQARKLAAAPESLRHLTRNLPRRADQILDGGSIYWMIKRHIRVRQRIVDIRRLRGRGVGEKSCALVLDPLLVQTAPVRRRPHQGWRYLEATDAPADLDAIEEATPDLPPEMAAELRELGLL